jgi:hypothetical protein
LRPRISARRALPSATLVFAVLAIGAPMAYGDGLISPWATVGGIALTGLAVLGAVALLPRAGDARHRGAGRGRHRHGLDPDRGQPARPRASSG